VVNVPAASGLSLAANVFEPTFSMCSLEGIVDPFFVDAVIVNQLTKLPCVNPGTFPMFMHLQHRHVDRGPNQSRQLLRRRLSLHQSRGTDHFPDVLAV
jgi:hypothetical protein